ncbi:hypothetical protein N431DRAFT_473415 [Stipitochalara longipes BDJ]|nr:hypothetical protein N431DRAFT_473415 [Stipitochalara longipes BDJ]
MPESNVIGADSTKAVELLATALEHLKQQTLANPTDASFEDAIAKVEGSTRIFKQDLEYLRQQKLIYKATLEHEVAKSDESSGPRKKKVDSVQEGGSLPDLMKGTFDHKLPEEFQALDCDRLESMNLAYWQEKRLGHQSAEADINLKGVESLEYLSLIGLDLAYLQQQRLVRSTRASIAETDDGQRRTEQQITGAQTRINCEDDNPLSVYMDKLRRTAKQSSTDQSFSQPGALESTEEPVPFGQQESRLNRNSRALGTLSNEIDSFTSYYFIGDRKESSDVIAHRKLGAGTQQPQAIASSRPQNTTDPAYATKNTSGQESKNGLNVAKTTKSSGSWHAVNVAIPKIKSWEASTTARAAKTSGLLASAIQTATPRARSSQAQSGPPDLTTIAAKVSPVQSTAPRFQSSQVQSDSTTPVHIATPRRLNSRAYARPTTSAQITSPNTPKKNENSNASPNKTQNIQSEKKTDQKSQSPHRRQNRPSIPISWTTETITETTSLQKTSDVPNISITKKLQKQNFAAVGNEDKTKTSGAKIELRSDDTSEPAEAGSHNTQDDSIPTIQSEDPPKTLSKSAKKKANQKQNKAKLKERERKEAAEIEAAIAFNREEVARIRENEAVEALASLRIERLDPVSDTTRASLEKLEKQSRFAVYCFLGCLTGSEAPSPQSPLPLPQEDILALVSQGYAALDWHYTELESPPSLETVIRLLDQVLAALEQIYPGLSGAPRTDVLTRDHAETLLLGCVNALRELAKKDAPHNLQQQPESPSHETESVAG